MKLFDGHCDTAYELWTRGEGLERNSCHIDLPDWRPMPRSLRSAATPAGLAAGRSAC